MVVGTTIVEVEYVGDGATVTFPITFAYDYKSNVKVYVNGVLKTYLTHYSIDDLGDYGNVVFYAAPADYTPPAAHAVVITRETTKKQIVPFTDSNPVPASSYEEAIDRLVLMVQELQKDVEDALEELEVVGGTPLQVTIDDNQTDTELGAVTVDSATEKSMMAQCTVRRKTDDEERLSTFMLSLVWSGKDSIWKVGKGISTALTDLSDRITFGVNTVGTVGTLTYSTNNMPGANYEGYMELLITKFETDLF